MIGNDVIDLALARKQSNWQRGGILDKIFVRSEQQAIVNAEDSELMFWNLWSRKEAAYKIYNRKTRVRAFIPKQLECFDSEFIDGAWFGKVTIKDNCYFTKTLITHEYIYSTAVMDVTHFKKIQFINTEEISKDSDGVPYVTLTRNPVSITHHGRFEIKITLDGNIQP